MRMPGKQWRSDVVAVGLILLLGCAGSLSAATRGSSRMKTILVLGDSLSDGFTLPRRQAYPALLTDKLRATGLEFEITNASQTGGTSEDGLRRLPAELKHKIDIFVLELGINDAFLGHPIGEIRTNLQAIIDKVRANNPDVRVIIAGMQLPDYSSEDYVREFGHIYAELAEKNRAALIPYLLQGVGGDPDFCLPDRIHPNAEGHKVLAKNVWEVLEPIAREVAGSRGMATKP